MAPSQTWRTFLTNHIGQLTLISTRRHRGSQALMTSSTFPRWRLANLSRGTTNRLALSSAMSSIGVLRFNGHHVTRVRFKILAKPSPFGTLPAEDRRHLRIG